MGGVRSVAPVDERHEFALQEGEELRSSAGAGARGPRNGCVVGGAQGVVVRLDPRVRDAHHEDLGHELVVQQPSLDRHEQLEIPLSVEQVQDRGSAVRARLIVRRTVDVDVVVAARRRRMQGAQLRARDRHGGRSGRRLGRRGPERRAYGGQREDEARVPHIGALPAIRPRPTLAERGVHASGEQSRRVRPFVRSLLHTGLRR
jgi:hypothetical protein